MRIAIGALAEDQINPGHFGESPGFMIVDADTQGVPQHHEWRPNPWCEEPIATRPPKIAALLRDCDSILVRSIAKEGLAQLSQRFTVMLTNEMNIPTLLTRMEADGTTGLRRFDREAGKFVGGA